jgi:hypothetical protein
MREATRIAVRSLLVAAEPKLGRAAQLVAADMSTDGEYGPSDDEIRTLLDDLVEKLDYIETLIETQAQIEKT